jgi:alcohol dehydrogenase
MVLETTGGPEAIRPRDLPEPRPGPGEVLVRLRAASLNYRDLVVARGGYGPGQKRDLVPLSDGAGEVVEVSPGVTDLKVGDRVVGCFFQDWPAGRPTPARLATALGGNLDGVACERRVFPVAGVMRFPAHLSFAEAATLPCAAVTAWSALFVEGRLQPGAVIVTQGTGGVSIFAIQLAAAAGARIVATSSTDAKLQRLRDLGVAEVINHRQAPDWGKQVRALTGGEGADLVVEIGGAGTLAQSMRAIRSGGTIALIGVVTGGKAELPLGPVVTSGMRLCGVTVGSREALGDLLRTVALRQLRPVTDRTFGLAELPAALAYLESGRHVGKVLIEI